MRLVKGEAHDFWMQQMAGLKTHANKLKVETGVEEQRRQFDFLSQLMIGTLQAFGTGGRELFVQFCPMAFDDQGASWISEEEKVFNPYFGEKMLKCGVVKETLQ